MSTIMAASGENRWGRGCFHTAASGRLRGAVGMPCTSRVEVYNTQYGDVTQVVPPPPPSTRRCRLYDTTTWGICTLQSTGS